jgi:hypothetical protein
MGGVVTKPGIVTSVVETAECLLDQRHLDAATLASMLDEAKRASEQIAAGEAVFWAAGEEHETRTDVGLKALILEAEGLEAFRYRS